MVSTSPPDPLPRHRPRPRTVLALAVAATVTVIVPVSVLPAAAVRPSTAVVTIATAGTYPASDSTERLRRPPVDGVVRARFRAPGHPWSAGHRGIDLLSTPGAVVRSPAAGVVTFADVVVDRPVVTITHADGLRSSLEPVTATVDVGTHVAAGEAIGTLGPGRGHCPADHCLHWGVRSGDVYLDPLDLLPGSGPVVLLPVEAAGRRGRLRPARSP